MTNPPHDPDRDAKEFPLDRAVGFHPISEILPKMTPAEYAELRADIGANGLILPIVLFEDLILDGRHRNLACLDEGKPRRFTNFEGTWDAAVEYVKSMNLKRRNLDVSQRAYAAAKLANLRRGRPGENPQICGNISQTAAAEMLNVSERSVTSAAKVLNQGIPELIEQVESGQTTVSRAATIAAFSPAKQKKMISNGQKSAAKTLKRLKLKSLKGSQDGLRSCLRCNPDADFHPDNISAFLQTLQIKAAAYAKKNRTTNYGPCFDSIILEIEEEKLSDLTIGNSEKILAFIARGTVDGETGIAEEGDIIRVTGMSRAEFDEAIGHLLRTGQVVAVKMGGKHDNARGGRKNLYKLVSESDRPTIPDAPDDDEPADIYYSDDDYGPGPDLSLLK